MAKGQRDIAGTVAPAAGRMLLRGAARRCAACGRRKLFTGWCRMAGRCPSCGYRFEREEGFFLGAYVLNLVIAPGMAMVLAVMPSIVLLNTNPDASLWPVVFGGVVGAVVAPFVFYPYSKTLRVAIELTLGPIDEPEPSDVRPASRPE